MLERESTLRKPSLRTLLFLSLLLLLAPTGYCHAEDWPTWRHDAGRTAVSSQELPNHLSVLWVLHNPPLQPAFANERLQFDAGYEPVVKGKTLFLGSSRDDCLVAYDTETGAERWRFYTDGPVRVAPVAWKDRVIFGSDDGCVYCVNGADGKGIWRCRAVPSTRKVLGSGRLISVWPVRGGPVVADDTIYFAAGVLPFEGVFIYALDAQTGKVDWLNDRAGFIYGPQPHGGRALGGLSPQGYLVVNGDELVVPCGAANHARFDRSTGALKEFALPAEGRMPWGWFMASDADQAKEVRRGTLQLDATVNRERHEDKIHQGPGESDIATTITAGGKTFSFSDSFEGVSGEVHSLVAADDKLFIVARSGSIYCFGPGEGKGIVHKPLTEPRREPERARADEIAPMLAAVGQQSGYALLWGVGDGKRTQALVSDSDLQVIGLDADANKINTLRSRYTQAGLYGTRVAFHSGEPSDFGFPPYTATLLVCDDPNVIRKGEGADFIKEVFRCLRPYGGTAFLRVPEGGQDELARLVDTAKLAKATLRRSGDWAVLARVGALPGATNYTGAWTSPDEGVKAPLGTLWFGGGITRFKRAPQPWVVDGVMVSQDKEWLEKSLPMGPATRAQDPGTGCFLLAAPEYMDVYTGRLLQKTEVASSVTSTLKKKPEEPRPGYHYRPPYVTERAAKTKEEGFSFPFQLTVDKGERTNPMTGLKEPRDFIKSYGCEGGNDYGYLFTMRSATAAFYDKRIESGTINITGPRSGCTNSVIPANGILNVPYFYEGCSCSYPVPAGLALITMPQEYEQWTAWGKGASGPIQRIGINLGAPGDRVTEAGTLWLDYPSVGGPSPEVSVSIEPKDTTFYYRHSLWMHGGEGWPWVCASGAKGIQSLKLAGLKNGAYTIRLCFAEPEKAAPGTRVFHVSLQGKPVLQDVDPARDAGGPMRSLMRACEGILVKDGTLHVELQAVTGTPILAGIELVAEGLPLDLLPRLER